MWTDKWSRFKQSATDAGLGGLVTQARDLAQISVSNLGGLAQSSVSNLGGLSTNIKQSVKNSRKEPENDEVKRLLLKWNTIETLRKEILDNNYSAEEEFDAFKQSGIERWYLIVPLLPSPLPNSTPD
jgi:hypothetical protein